MLSIRLSRIGKKKQPYYRLIVVDKKHDPWGKALEILGSYNPRNKQATFKKERIEHWLNQGAQASNSVWNLLIETGLIKGEKRSVTHISKKRAEKLEKGRTPPVAEEKTNEKDKKDENEE